jgi:hypothetical protein
MTKIKRNEISNVLNRLSGLDNLGRAKLDKAIGQLQSESQLPDKTLEDLQQLREVLNVISDKTLQEVLKVIIAGFKTGLEDGYGFDLSIDENGLTTLEVDKMRVRSVLSVKEFLRQQIRATNGNVFVTSTGKVRTAKQK